MTMAEPLKTGYAVYPSVSLRSLKTDPETGEKELVFLKELLFGDFISPSIRKDGTDYVRVSIDKGKNKGEYIKVRSRNATGYIKESEMQAQRILEVNFIDVGQGDGCHIATPDDRHFLIDAGGSDNMYRFLKWRFNLRSSKVAPPPFTVLISHSDTDHYEGFKYIFERTKGAAQQFTIEKIYHNGIVESSAVKGTPALAKLGTVTEHAGSKYITDLCDTDEDYQKRIKEAKQGVYMQTLNKSTAPKQAVRLGSKPIYDKDGLKMEIMAPVAQEIDGKAALPYFGSVSKTKNGHSVVIKLTMGKLRILLGGDLNTESEYYLIRHYSGVDVAKIMNQLKKGSLKEADRQALEAQVEEAILKARESLEVDIAKSCHHGSSDFTSEFLRVLNPIATVISSGDDEPYAHPRPDTLGTIGKFSRGERSLIFSTELARSGKEFLKLDEIKSTEEKKERVVTVYGMINVRTDGEKVVIAQKYERKTGKGNWDIHRLSWNEKKGEFEYIQDEKDS